jgi:hypothetical protein
VVPVTVTELLYPSRRGHTWLRKTGVAVVCAVFAFGSFIAWFSWTQLARPNMHAVLYHPPLLALASGIAAILLLIGMAYTLRDVGGEMGADANHAPGSLIPSGLLIPLTAGVAAFVFGGVWFKLIAMLFTPVNTEVWIPLTAGSIGLICAYALFRALSSIAWSDMRRWAVSFGAILACAAATSISAAGYKHSDFVAKIILDVLALIALLWLGVKVRRRAALENGKLRDEPGVAVIPTA